jgi:hypothetical protein
MNILINKTFDYIKQNNFFFTIQTSLFLKVWLIQLFTNLSLLFIVFKNAYFYYFLPFKKLSASNLKQIFFVNFKFLKLVFNYKNLISDYLVGSFVEFFLEGLYYRVKFYKKKNYLGFLIGYSHYVIIQVPRFIFVKVHTKRRKFVIGGVNRQQVGLFSRMLTDLKFPNIYMGKGVKIITQTYRKKKMLKKR